MNEAGCFYDGSPSELGVREIVRHGVGYELTQIALNAAMRVHTPHSYRCSVLLDGASPLAIAVGAQR
ncbi:hypothetical protein [Aurantimonas coralicida]|uniref:hypothetical protein n=1 Tax=Aurantimonas coralicida TaxID=182270 RepID=UPI0023888DC5|nr:hypothetical protein [Aurantimonas coralicida]MDE0921486.1 hypothetical protein [Aurantimonas coralicida]